MQSGHLQRAEGFFTRAAEQHPTDFRNRANLARTHFRSGEISKAIQEMEAAVELSDNDPWMTVELGQMYLAKGDLDRLWQGTFGRVRQSSTDRCLTVRPPLPFLESLLIFRRSENESLLSLHDFENQSDVAQQLE